MIEIDTGAVAEYLVSCQTAGKTELIVDFGLHFQAEPVGVYDVIVDIIFFNRWNHAAGNHTCHGSLSLGEGGTVKACWIGAEEHVGQRGWRH